MSVLLNAFKKKDFSDRDMSKRRKVMRKAGHVGSDGIPQKTTDWTIDIGGKVYNIVFSRDNFYVWINGYAVDSEAYISDEGYDVDIYFAVDEHKGHICSDVEDCRGVMTNYLVINGNCVAVYKEGEDKNKAK